MNVLSRVMKFEEAARELRLRQPRWISRPLPQRQHSKAVDGGDQQMRWIGVAMCLVSAAITVASATLIAVRF
ncbi:MAG: hypothetical protein U1E33_02220 [Rhodospirillales bacterium]